MCLSLSASVALQPRQRDIIINIACQDAACSVYKREGGPAQRAVRSAEQYSTRMTDSVLDERELELGSILRSAIPVQLRLLSYMKLILRCRVHPKHLDWATEVFGEAQNNDQAAVPSEQRFEGAAGCKAVHCRWD